MSAQTWTQKGTDIEGLLHDEKSGFSTSISADGNTVAIGSPTGNSGYAGLVRVFEWSGGMWNPKGATLDGVAFNGRFGWDVSLSDDGNLLAVGSPIDNSVGVDAGKVQMFEWSGTSWIQKGNSIYGAATGDNAGRSVSLSGDGSTVIVGSPYYTSWDEGHTRVFHWVDSLFSWEQKGLDIMGTFPMPQQSFFGSDVSINTDGTVIAIGAPKAGFGRVFLYHWDGSMWVQRGTYINGDSNNDEFGYAISLSSDGNTVAIGAPGNDDNGTGSGHAQVHEWNGSSWTQRGQDIPALGSADAFGTSIDLSIDGNTVAVGAPGFGYVKVFRWDAAFWTWSAVGSLIYDGQALENIGFSVALNANGTTVAMGNTEHDHSNGLYTEIGKVQVYSICESIQTSDTVASCDPYTWINGITYSESISNVTHSIATSDGCDSVITLHLTIPESSADTQSVQACESYTWMDGITYTTSNNTASMLLVNSAGCDSVVHLDLTVNYSSFGTEAVTACNSFTWIDGNTYFESNNSATFTLINAAGCDSVVTLDLNIDHSLAEVTTLGPALTASTAGAYYQWMDCDNDYIGITGETFQTFTATSTGNYAVEVTKDGCTDTSACVSITVTGLNTEQPAASVSVYPNPSSGKVSIDLGDLKAVSISVFDVNGKQIFQETSIQGSTHHLELNRPSGMYFVEIRTTDFREIQKLVLVK